MNLKDELSFFKDLKSKYAWTGRFRGSPSKWSQADGIVVLKALEEAKKNPVYREVDPKKLARRPKALKAKIGSVSVPSDDSTDLFVSEASHKDIVTETKVSEHTEIQYLLLKLGSEMGFDLWVARNDRNKSFDGEAFNKILGIKSDLPLQFDEATNKTIELIDVLWLQGNAIVSAFEIESTTSVYSGLLRMSDLITMQPNINIPLFIVAPDEKRNKVSEEINRPTFSRLQPPLSEICKYISFSTLRKEIDKVKSIVRYIKPEYLDEISETCEIEEI
jgi:hypothetical protein